MDIVYRLGEYVVRTRFEDLPSRTVDLTKQLILDTLGVAIAGSSAEGVKEVVEQILVSPMCIATT